MADKKIIANMSNRHAHLSRADMDVLFGPGSELTKLRDLMQPGQFACKETITVVGPKGKMENVRIIGPLRKATQVEISRTDTFVFKFAAEPPVRESGDLDGSAPVEIAGPKGKVTLKQGCILALRHLHMSPADAAAFGVADKQIVKVRAGIGTCRATVFENVVCRVSPQMALECHLDVDEGNACLLKNGDPVELIKE